MIHRIRAVTRAEVPTSSMADIAFLLLIFFLVTTVFDEERGLQIVLPDGDTVEVSGDNIAFFGVRADGLVEVQRGKDAQVQLVTADEIDTLWRLELQQNPLLIAAVRTHPDAPYRFMIDVLDKLKTAGAERISLQVGR